MSNKPNSAAHNREFSYRKALRKKQISDCWVLIRRYSGHPYYDNLHQYSKNKIHYYWGSDARYYKTNNKGHRRRIKGNYAPSYNPCRRDKWRQMAMDQDEKDFFDFIEKI